MEDIVEELLHRFGRVGFPARKELEEQQAESVHVSLPGERFPSDLFRRHVLRRSQHETRLRHGQVFGLGDTEIHHLHHARRSDVNVVGLNVTMDDFLCVYISQRARYLESDVKPGGNIAEMSQFNRLPQCLTLQEFHHHERAVLIVLAKIVDAENVVVRDVAGHAGFRQEPRFGVGVGATGFRQDLHRYGASNYGIHRAVNRGHSAAQVLIQLVLADAHR